ncbi:AAA family ATPase [Cyanobacterium aponinum]|uniref:Nuclease SbcCD subunit C n=1 Tax=Cyanobacterium aponinum (strain PCC 10605) TaxID=755178 RepID=K9Z5M4_CYAAP|nr:AAA family ATPase [Cyanobacterium aponinum]AFZ54491.1 SMC domain protein [Cyanobacterium aponinum PCC 10605]
MIPRKLTLKNFLSYRHAELDFTGLHTACICGANGAGKSSLLEAITWVVWGKTRTASDDDLIHLGERETRVDFEFIYDEQHYRIIRTRQRKNGSTLDFQIINEQGYKSIGGKGLRDTENKIKECLKIDYDTFTNSAYLRQGRADEFMLRSPSERRKILADLLKLDQYENLANEAKELARDFKIKAEEISRNLEENKEKLEEKQSFHIAIDETEKELAYFQKKQTVNQEELQTIQLLNNQRSSLKQRYDWQQNQVQTIAKKIQQLQQEKADLEQEIKKITVTLSQEEDINTNYEQWQKLREEDEGLNIKFNQYQQFLEKKQTLEQSLQKESNDLILAIQREKTKLENLINQEKELEAIVNKTSNLEADLEKLNICRQKLSQLDEIQVQANTLLQQKQSLETEINREEAMLLARLKQLENEENNIQTKLNQVPQIRQEFFTLETRLKEIENTKNYQKRVQEKGEQRNLLIQRYLDNQSNLENQIKKLNEKLETLNQDHAVCPLCERELDDTHLEYVINKTQNEQQQIVSQSSYYEIEIINCKRELDNLRKEYAQLNQELALEDSLKQDYARLENQLDSIDDTYNQYELILEEKADLQNKLDTGNYAQDNQSKLREIIEQINNLNYSQENHALLRKEEANLRRVEFQQSRIKDAQNQLKKLAQQKPDLQTNIESLENRLENLRENSPLQLQLRQIEEEIKSLNYDRTYHQNIRKQGQQLQPYQLLYGDLQQAKKQYPQLSTRQTQIETNLTQYNQEKETGEKELNSLQEQLSSLTDYSQELAKLEQEASNCQENINRLLTAKGRLEQSLTNLKDRENDVKELENRLQETQKKYRIYQELTFAFGRRGIQSLMIENILPQLQDEANHILNSLTGSQLSVQFLTQKPKASRSKKSSSQYIDTLEIIISDAQGTRSYETYSGGEAFRINFAIRLALSRILAQRAGTRLQLLIVDEGFGTQDTDGCNRLIGALNAIASEFACILTVTHVNQFKEAFQTRIEVYKTQEGSKIKLSS